MAHTRGNFLRAIPPFSVDCRDCDTPFPAPPVDEGWRDAATHPGQYWIAYAVPIGLYLVGDDLVCSICKQKREQPKVADKLAAAVELARLQLAVMPTSDASGTMKAALDLMEQALTLLKQ